MARRGLKLVAVSEAGKESSTEGVPRARRVDRLAWEGRDGEAG